MKRYLEGVSLAALSRGNRRMLAPLKARHQDAKAEHVEALAAWQERRAKAREIKEPEKRAAALEELKGERPTHPVLVAAGCTVVAAVVAWPMLHGRHTVVVAGGLTLWVLVALALGQTTPEQAEQPPAGAPDVAPDGGAEEDQDEPEDTAPTGPTPADVHRLVASRTVGGTSLLLTRITAELAPYHPGWEPSTKAVRALLAEAGIPVREGVRTPDGNGPGVHHQDVPALPSPSAPALAPSVVANVGPGRSANANANNTDEPAGREGFVLQADPDNPARTIVVHTADAA
ncbi:hypothetical protein J5Y04_23025 [Kitasatospora sp. RG8]|uniref:hypothetical protein n=1 Tax=Kitasatospora sp. RG8 TaxID=2820815 RepID=UPI001ADFDD72|nr:hypothetical protein [Kitasatospora sp. RG8]MBP0452394.1 hypothetical protein [Kitasatospora sp. RG8]